MAAAHALATGEADVSLCLMGGQTHARRDCASGFSYVNDVVLAILQLLRVPAPDPQPERRVLFVNVDGHHCSGVEEAFFTTDRVCTVSLHRYAVGIFPGSGGLADVGAEQGKHHNINLPVADGLDDAGLALLLHPVLTAVAERFCPHCVVVCAGGGILAGDRLGCLNVSLDGHAAYLKLLLDLGLPTLVLGAGGYTQLNTARAWVSTAAAACGVELDRAAPLPTAQAEGSSLLEGYPAGLTLDVPLTTMENMNTDGALARIRARALATIEQMPQRTKPAPPVRKVAVAPVEEAPAAPVKMEEGGAAAAVVAAPEGAVAPAADSGAAVSANAAAAPTGGEAAIEGGAEGGVCNGVGGAEAVSNGPSDVAAAPPPAAPPAPVAEEAAVESMEVEGEPAVAAAAAAGGDGGGGGGGGDGGDGGDGDGGDGGGAVDVSMSEDRMQAQEPGLGDDE